LKLCGRRALQEGSKEEGREWTLRGKENSRLKVGEGLHGFICFRAGNEEHYAGTWREVLKGLMRPCALGQGGSKERSLTIKNLKKSERAGISRKR